MDGVYLVFSVFSFLAVFWSALHKAFLFHWDLLPVGWKDLQIVRQLYSSGVCQQRPNPSHGTVSFWLQLSKKSMNRNKANLSHLYTVCTDLHLFGILPQLPHGELLQLFITQSIDQPFVLLARHFFNDQ